MDLLLEVHSILRVLAQRTSTKSYAMLDDGGDGGDGGEDGSLGGKTLSKSFRVDFEFRAPVDWYTLKLLFFSIC